MENIENPMIRFIQFVIIANKQKILGGPQHAKNGKSNIL